jgi:transposase InsO family protein
MVLPKTPWLAEQNVIGDWPVYSLPTTIHLDNARDFRGRALAWGVAEHGINLIHRPVARPHYGGHIERLIGTMMGAVHFLPGSTSSDIDSRGDYDPQKHAVMTFDELERWLALEIVGRYHADIHHERAAASGLRSRDGSAEPRRNLPRWPKNRVFPLILGGRHTGFATAKPSLSILATYRWLQHQPTIIPCEEP